MVHDSIAAVAQASGGALLCCSNCGQTLADYDGDYKSGLLVDEGEMMQVPLVRDPAQFIDDEMVFRRYCCPGCRQLKLTEVARAADATPQDMRLSAP